MVVYAAPTSPTISMPGTLFNRDFFINSAIGLTGEENSNLDPPALDSRVALPADHRSVFNRVRIRGAPTAGTAADCRNRRMVERRN